MAKAITRTLSAAISLILACGCARLPDVNRIQNNMDTMVHYMGVMASGMPVMVNSTQRMAATAERMERKSDGLLADLQQKGGSAEKAIQNYSQAFIDNDRAVIKNLQGIRTELGDLKQSMRHPSPSAEPQEQARVNAQVQNRLNELEAKLTAIAARLERITDKPPR